MNDPIEHIIVLMLENRSFDQMLGCLPGVDGVDEARFNVDKDGKKYYQASNDWTTLFKDPGHKYKDVVAQLQDNNAHFVDNYTSNYYASTPAQRQQIMGYYRKLSALHTLAENFMICDRWFSSVPGPTWPNRFFIHSGTSKGKVRMNMGPILSGWYDQDTIFDRLNQHDPPVSWKVYYDGWAVQSRLLVHQSGIPENDARYFGMSQFMKDVEGPVAQFPAYCFVEPNYSFNDDHPPHDIIEGEKFIADMYNAIRSNEELWNSSLLVIVYDEHGGFYDHVSPPAAVPPDQYAVDGYHFTQLGVRVPALLVSPWVRQGVCNKEFDHTSLLRYVIEKWKLAPLTARVSEAKSIGVLIQNGQPRTDTPAKITVSMTPKPDMPPPDEVPPYDGSVLPYLGEKGVKGTRYLNSNLRGLMWWQKRFRPADAPTSSAGPRKIRKRGRN